MKEQLIDTLPSGRQRTVTIDMQPEDPEPQPDQYIVSVGKNRVVGTVYLIAEVRKVKSTTHHYRYVIKVFACPDLKKAAKVDWRWQATIGGQPAISIVWNSRKKKSK